jgi:hypothetical protein
MAATALRGAVLDCVKGAKDEAEERQPKHDREQVAQVFARELSVGDAKRVGRKQQDEEKSVDGNPNHCGRGQKVRAGRNFGSSISKSNRILAWQRRRENNEEEREREEKRTRKKEQAKKKKQRRGIAQEVIRTKPIGAEALENVALAVLHLGGDRLFRLCNNFQMSAHQRHGKLHQSARRGVYHELRKGLPLGSTVVHVLFVVGPRHCGKIALNDAVALLDRRRFSRLGRLKMNFVAALRPPAGL